jgi:GABA permease
MAEKARVLVVANKTALSDELRQAMLDRAGRGPVEFVLLVPATAHGVARVMDPYVEEGQIAGQEEQAVKVLRAAGLDVVEGKLGDPDPLAAVEDELNIHGPYDEIIVSTLPTHLSKWLKLDLPHKVQALTDNPVTHVIGQEVEAPA